MKGLPKLIAFEWDKGNSDKNCKKHDVSNQEAEEIFFNRPLKIFVDEKHSISEERFIAHGVANDKRRLTIIFTIRKQKVRVISARDMHKKERGEYEKT